MENAPIQNKVEALRKKLDLGQDKSGEQTTETTERP